MPAHVKACTNLHVNKQWNILHNSTQELTFDWSNNVLQTLELAHVRIFWHFEHWNSVRTCPFCVNKSNGDNNYIPCLVLYTWPSQWPHPTPTRNTMTYKMYFMEKSFTTATNNSICLCSNMPESRSVMSNMPIQHKDMDEQDYRLGQWMPCVRPQTSSDVWHQSHRQACLYEHTCHMQ